MCASNVASHGGQDTVALGTTQNGETRCPAALGCRNPLPVVGWAEISRRGGLLGRRLANRKGCHRGGRRGGASAKQETRGLLEGDTAYSALFLRCMYPYGCIHLYWGRQGPFLDRPAVSGVAAAEVLSCKQDRPSLDHQVGWGIMISRAAARSAGQRIQVCRASAEAPSAGARWHCRSASLHPSLGGQTRRLFCQSPPS